MDFYAQQRWLRARKFSATQRAYDHVVKVAVRYDPGAPMDKKPFRVVVYGDGSRFFGGAETQAKLRGQPSPSRKLERVFSAHPLVSRFVLLDEYLTSKIGPYSKKR